MNRNLTIYCDDNSLNFQEERRLHTVKNSGRLYTTNSKSPSGESTHYKIGRTFNFPTQHHYCQTPQQRTKSPYSFKSPKYTGIIQKTLMQRLQFYDKQAKLKKRENETVSKLKLQQFCSNQILQKPQINEISKNLYEKIKKQRKLSPNILQRFQTYECQRVSRNAKYELLKTFGMNIKNDTPTCRAVNRQTSKSFLKQKNFNNQRSKSKNNDDKTRGSQKMKLSSNIGKIIKTNTENCQINQRGKGEKTFQTSWNKNLQRSPHKYKVYVQEIETDQRQKSNRLKDKKQKKHSFLKYQTEQGQLNRYTTLDSQMKSSQVSNQNDKIIEKSHKHKQKIKDSPFYYQNKTFNSNKKWRVVA